MSLVCGTRAAFRDTGPRRSVGGHMRHLDRKDAPDTLWHVSARVNWQAWHLVTEQAFRAFTDCFGRAVERFAMDLIAFVLMSNHFHAVLRSPPEHVYRQ